MVILPSCLGTKYLKEGEKLLVKQKIKTDSNIDKEELSQFYAQKPNRQLPIIPFSPYVWFYYHGLQRYDVKKYEKQKTKTIVKWNSKINQTDKERKKNRLIRKKKNKIDRIDKNIEQGNVWMRWGEPVAAYDSALSNRSMDQFKLYLSSKGYFNATINRKLHTRGKVIKESFDIIPNEPYIIDTAFIQTTDSAVLQLIYNSTEDSHIKEGENYDQANLSHERERLDELLKDNGYFEFSRQYIEFEVDTAFRKAHRVAIKTKIKTPIASDTHRVFSIDSINFIVDDSSTEDRDTLNKVQTYQGINFINSSKNYNDKVISRRVFIEKDQLYNRTNTFDTQRQLANLDVFRFINIKYDSIDGKLISNIYTSPLNRYQWSNEVGINVTQGFPGPFYNLAFKKRNVFRGLENFEINGRVGIEGVAPASDKEDIYASVEAGINATLTFPQFVLPISPALKERLGKINPKTRLLAGYTYVDRPEYNRINLNVSNSYSWDKKLNARYQFTLTDISLIRSDLTNDFEEILRDLEDRGNNLINSFRPSFVSSMVMSATWNFNSYGLNFNNSSFLRVFAESGGTTLNFINTEFLEREALEFYKYLKLNIDYRKVRPINANTSLAYRINAGIARPYSSNKVLPYEKYFFAGGSNGIRAWRPRRLGPGAFTPVDSDGNLNYDFEQQGEILFEGSLELRKNLIGFIDYALFLDFGNTWTIEQDNSRPGAQFKFNDFISEIALGTGLGLRFDFSFLILRLDAGVKMYDPARPLNQRFVFGSGYDKEGEGIFTAKDSEPVVFNIGIGYPF